MRLILSLFLTALLPSAVLSMISPCADGLGGVFVQQSASQNREVYSGEKELSWFEKGIINSCAVLSGGKVAHFFEILPELAPDAQDPLADDRPRISYLMRGAIEEVISAVAHTERDDENRPFHTLLRRSHFQEASSILGKSVQTMQGHMKCLEVILRFADRYHFSIDEELFGRVNAVTHEFERDCQSLTAISSILECERAKQLGLTRSILDAFVLGDHH